MNNGSAIFAAPTTPAVTPTGEQPEWCILDHSDPMCSENCHVSDIDWVSGLGVSLGTSDDAPVGIEVWWDFANSGNLTWTPAEARRAAIALLQLAETAEASA